MKTFIAAFCALAIATLPLRAQSAGDAVQPDSEGWIITRTTAQIDGAQSYYAMKQSESVLRNSVGNQTRPTLILSCVGGNLMLAFKWPTYLGFQQVTVKTSTDGGPVKTWTFGVTNRDLAVVMGRKKWPKMVDTILNGKRLVVQALAYSDAYEAVFDLEGVSRVMGEAEATCPR